MSSEHTDVRCGLRANPEPMKCKLQLHIYSGMQMTHLLRAVLFVMSCKVMSRGMIMCENMKAEC